MFRVFSVSTCLSSQPREFSLTAISSSSFTCEICSDHLVAQETLLTVIALLSQKSQSSSVQVFAGALELMMLSSESRASEQTTA